MQQPEGAAERLEVELGLLPEVPGAEADVGGRGLGQQGEQGVVGDLLDEGGGLDAVGEGGVAGEAVQRAARDGASGAAGFGWL